MAYLRLIWIYYETEKPLPNDIDLLAFKVGCDKETIAMLLQCYFYANALHWHHKRIDSELEQYKLKSEKASKSAKSRWNNANAMRTHSEGNANQEPITNNHKPINNINTDNSVNTVSLPAQPEKRKSSPVKGFRMPKDWVLRKDQGEWALKERPDLTPDAVRKLAEAFRDHFLAKTGKGSTSTDWNLNWHNWVRNDLKFNGHKANGNHYGKKPDVGERAFARLREIQEAHPNGIDLGSLDDPL
jgi:uncharacterized protein YdaU (DUF1376 family)